MKRRKPNGGRTRTARSMREVRSREAGQRGREGMEPRAGLMAALAEAQGG